MILIQKNLYKWPSHMKTINSFIGSMYIRKQNQIHLNYSRINNFHSHHQFLQKQPCPDNIFSDVLKSECIRRVKMLKPPILHKVPKLEASVMVPLCLVDNKSSILFTVRSPKMVRNKNDVSFPGGKKDSVDADRISVALREVEEEIGITSKSIDIWTTMPCLPSRSFEFFITPVIAHIGSFEPKNCKFNEKEVESVFTIPISDLCIPSNLSYTTFKTKGMNYSLPVFIVNNYRIWGVTAAILHFVLTVLIPNFYNYPPSVKRNIELFSR